MYRTAALALSKVLLFNSPIYLREVVPVGTTSLSLLSLFCETSPLRSIVSQTHLFHSCSVKEIRRTNPYKVCP